MTSVQISGGVISVEDGTKKAEEYAPPRKVRIELHFDVPADADATKHIDAVSALAQAKLKALLMGTVAATEVLAVHTPAKAETKAGKSDKDKLAEAAGLAPAADKTAPKAPRGGAKAKEKPEPAAQTNFDDLTTSDPVKPAEDPDDLTISPAAEITDADLNHEVQVKNGEIANPKAIKTLIGSYNPDPTKQFTLREIKATDRVDFVAKLKALTKES